MKYVEIEAKQIEAKLDVKLPEILGITGTDLGVLFGNILIMQSKHASLAKRKMDRLVCSIRKSWNCHLL